MCQPNQLLSNSIVSSFFDEVYLWISRGARGSIASTLTGPADGSQVPRQPTTPLKMTFLFGAQETEFYVTNASARITEYWFIVPAKMQQYAADCFKLPYVQAAFSVAAVRPPCINIFSTIHVHG